ncbi:MAG: Gfo/Idh/MocA family oxidoreductase [Planctomycetota bacterium]
MNEPVCRWGILGAAQIARKNWKAIRLSGNGVVTAVASRDLDRATAFIRECSNEVPPVVRGQETTTMPAAVDDYQALLDRDDVDAVYIALPTGIRKPWVIAAAAAGKHVLCEKPAAVHGDDLEEMIAACREHRVGFMDGVMFDHSARLSGLRSTLDDPSRFGTLRRIQSHFSFNGGEAFELNDIRANASLEPHGCLGDLGWYCIRFSLWASGDRSPETVSGEVLSTIGDGSVPAEFRGEMRFTGGLSAGFYCSFRCVNQQTVQLSGDFGYVTLDDFVLPMVDAESRWYLHQHDLRIDNCRWNFGRHTSTYSVREPDSGEPESQEVNMIRHFARGVLAGTHDDRDIDVVVKTQAIVDALRRSAIGGGEWITLNRDH